MKLTTKEITIFGMLGAIMYISKFVMELFPNIHLIGVFTVAFTVVYKKKALYPIYTYVILNGVFCGFATCWLPNKGKMLLPKNMPQKVKPVVYMMVCSAHGFLFGALYAPAQALIYGLNFKSMVAWVIAGLPWDFIHGISNFFCGMLIMPIIAVLKLIK